MVGDNIKKRRESLKLTQEEVVKEMQEYYKEAGEEVGSFTQAQLSNWENNKSKPSLKNLNDLCIILDTTLDKLLEENQKKDFQNIFISEGYNVAKRLKKVTNKNDITTKIYELQNIIKKENIDELIHFFIEIYIEAKKSIEDEISIILLDTIVNKKDSDTKENFINYITMFEVGLHNGNVPKENEE